MNNLDPPVLIEEWRQNLDAAAYEKNVHKYIKLSSIKKQIDRHDKTEYWPTRKK